MLFNKASTLAYAPYRILEYLAYNNENIWKMMAYNTYDCLSQANISVSDKIAMVWRGESKQENYSVFLNRTIENAEPDATCILKIYRLDSLPVNHLISKSVYEFDFLFGSKISLVEYNGIPCNKGDVFEQELLETLNGADIGGVGLLQFNHELSTLSRSGMNIGNNKTYSGDSIIMAVQQSAVGEKPTLTV
jgi:hypothetical protein